jgi:hypothetical protein
MAPGTNSNGDSVTPGAISHLIPGAAKDKFQALRTRSVRRRP